MKKQNRKRAFGADKSDKESSEPQNGIKKILLLLRNHSGVDFSRHKSMTLQRRITRRMVLNKQNTLEDYARFLRGDAKELDALYADALTTVNEEMANRNAELNRLNSDLINLLTSTKLPIVLLGRDLTIRRFSVQAEKQFNLLATDVGRLISGLRHNLVVPKERSSRGEEAHSSSSTTESQSLATSAARPPFPVEEFVGEVIASVRESEREVRDKDGRWYSLRVRPYMTLDNRVDGAVLALVDIDDLKRTERETKAARNYAEATLRTARDPLIILHANLHVSTANEAFYKTFKTTPDQTEGRLIFELSGGAWRIPKLRILLEDILPRNSFFNDFEVTHDFSHLGRRTMLLNARRLDLDDGSPPMILLAIEDVTERQGTDVVTASLAAIVNSSDDAIIGKNLNGVITSWNKSAERLFGYTAQEAIGQPITMLIPPDRLHEEPQILARLKRGERVDHFETIRVRKGGSLLEISLTISPIMDATGLVIGASKIARDITERKRTEKALRESEERYRTLFNLGPVAVYSIDTSGVIQNFNRQAAELWGRAPALGDTDQRFCGSFKMFRPDGSYMPHEQCPMAEVVSGKIPAAHDAEVLIERPDGSRVIVIVNIRPLKNDRGEVTGAINCFYDITERKRTEEALRQSHAELRSHAEELDRFNRAAVGRELRMIELKKEVNELCQRQGQAAPYPLGFE